MWVSVKLLCHGDKHRIGCDKDSLTTGGLVGDTCTQDIFPQSGWKQKTSHDMAYRAFIG